MLVDAGDAGAAVGHESPLGADVPMQFADASADEPHFDAGHRFGNGQIADGDLAGPTASLDAPVRVGEWIFEWRLAAIVGFGREDGVGVGLIERGIIWPEHLLVVSGAAVSAEIFYLLGG